MKLVMTLLVRDEEEIVEANIEFHRAQGVDFFIVTDNLSQDRTCEKLRAYEKQGILELTHESGDDFEQSRWVTRMAQRAYCEHAADWVINNDADEFWCPAQGDLKQILMVIPGDVNVALAVRHNFVPLDESRGPFWARMVYRPEHSNNALDEPLPPKVCHRARPDVVVAEGNHSVRGTGADAPMPAPIEILHFPMRNWRQFEHSVAVTGAAFARNSRLPAGIGHAKRWMYALLQSNELAEFYRCKSYLPVQLLAAYRSGELVRDTRLRDLLRRSRLATQEGEWRRTRRIEIDV